MDALKWNSGTDYGYGGAGMYSCDWQQPLHTGSLMPPAASENRPRQGSEAQPGPASSNSTYDFSTRSPSIDGFSQDHAATNQLLSNKRFEKKRLTIDTSGVNATSPSSTSSSEKVTKRQRNTEAARRYRQRKVDRLTEVEEALASMTKERDELKLRLARSEAEADVLRGMVGRRR